MTENIYLTLKLNGNAIQGWASQTKRKGVSAGDIECYSLSWGVNSPSDQATGASHGRRIYDNLVITKRIDKSSPLLCTGIANNQNAAGTFKVFRPTTAGDGSSENFYRIDFTGGRITGINSSIGGTDFPLETISISATGLTWTYDSADGKGITAQDSWSQVS